MKCEIGEMVRTTRLVEGDWPNLRYTCTVVSKDWHEPYKDYKYGVKFEDGEIKHTVIENIYPI